MSDSKWQCTAAERRAIDAAWVEIEAAAESMGCREPHRLREALRIEQRDRSCTTVARALLVRGWVDGMRDDPPASTVAGYSEGIAAAVLLGADYGRRHGRRHDGLPSDGMMRLAAAADAASAAHGQYIARGLAAARASLTPPESAKPKRNRQ